MALTEDEVANRFPIHWMVWNNQHEELKTALASKKYSNEDIELKDPRGRTPLLLAVTLGRIDCVRVLIDAGADVNCEKDGWTAVQEATATGNAELLSLVLCQRDHRRRVVRSEGIPDLLRRLSLAPDFYVEMKWEFTSWVPLVSRMCPFDTYKIYKRGGNVRVDTTLVGFENNRWQRGDRTYIFRGQGKSASLMELDHEAGTSWTEYLEPLEDRAVRPASKHIVEQRLAHPLAINYLDTDKICFERNKSGIWGWRQDKTENVNGYECKVFGANNVELVSMTRTEHLPRADKEKRSPRAPLAGLLALADTDNELFEAQVDDNSRDSSPSTPREEVATAPRAVTWSEYFGTETLQQDIGRPKEISTKIQKFKATLWLCEDYPLQLQEQIMPILDLMAAVSSPHFAKLKDFVQMQLPAGFPVKIEIPLFHVLNARITFGNIFATETPVPHIDHIQEGDRLSCVVDDICFNVGRGYRDAAAPGGGGGLCGADDEQLLQYAIQQSLMQPGTHDDQVDVWEALRGASPANPSPLLLQEDTQLQRAIEASLASAVQTDGSVHTDVSADGHGPVNTDTDTDEYVDSVEQELAQALALSAREHHDLKLQLESEQRALDEALRLSLLDN